MDVEEDGLGAQESRAVARVFASFNKSIKSSKQGMLQHAESRGAAEKRMRGEAGRAKVDDGLRCRGETGWRMGKKGQEGR